MTNVIPLIKQADPASVVGTVNALVNSINTSNAAGDNLNLPGAPVPGAVYNANNIQYARIDNSPTQKIPLMISTGEPSVWEYPAGTHNLMGDNSSHQTYFSCTGDPMVAANWSGGTNVLGGGTGGEAGSALHSWVIPIGSTLYMWYIDSSGNLNYATAPLAAGTPVFTKQGTCIATGNMPGSGGNIAVIPYGGTYYMFLEYILSPYSYSVGLYSCATAGGTYTSVVHPLNSLRQSIPMLTVSHTNYFSTNGPWVGIDEDGQTLVMFHHSCTSGSGLNVPTDIFRATIPLASIATDGWTPSNQGWPVVTRTAPGEITQVGDPFIYRPSTGGRYMFYNGTCSLNGVGNSQMYITSLKPNKMVYDGYSWRNAEVTSDYIYPAAEWAGHIEQMMIAAMQPAGSFSPIEAVGTWALDYTVANAYVYGAMSQNTSAAQNDALWFDVYVAPGQYRLDVICETGPAQGIITVTLLVEPNAAQSWTTIDTYSSGTVYNVNLHVNQLQVNGVYPVHAKMKWTMASKNASSSGYGLGWMSWTLTRYT